MHHASFLDFCPTHQISIFVFTMFSKKKKHKTPSPFPPNTPPKPSIFPPSPPLVLGSARQPSKWANEVQFPSPRRRHSKPWRSKAGLPGTPPKDMGKTPWWCSRDPKIPWDPYLWGILEYGKSIGKGSHYWPLRIPLMEADRGLLASHYGWSTGALATGPRLTPLQEIFAAIALQKDDVGSWKTILSFWDGNFWGGELLNFRGVTGCGPPCSYGGPFIHLYWDVLLILSNWIITPI